MEPTRLAARSLVHDGRIEVRQKGSVLGVDEEYRGPTQCVSSCHHEINGGCL